MAADASFGTDRECMSSRHETFDRVSRAGARIHMAVTAFEPGISVGAVGEG